MKAGVIKCQKKWTCNPSSPIFVYFCFIFEASLAAASLACVAGAVYFFAGRARGTREGERRPLLFSLRVCSRLLPSSKKNRRLLRRLPIRWLCVTSKVPVSFYILQYLYVGRKIVVNIFQIKFSQCKLVMRN